MSILLDTHPFLWWLTGDPKLSPTARAAIELPGEDVRLSVASAWEITIKAGLGKLELPDATVAFLEDRLELHSIMLLPIELRHLARLSTLPPLHRDPFDRLLSSAIHGGRHPARHC